MDILLSHGVNPRSLAETLIAFAAADGGIVTLQGPGEKFMAKEIVPEWAKGLNERQRKAINYVQEHFLITNIEGRGRATKYITGRVMIRW